MILSPSAQKDILARYTQPRQTFALPAYQNNNAKTEAFHAHRGVKIRAIFGGDRSGKSEAGGFELVDMARQFPGSNFWACAMTYPKLKINAEKILKYLSKDEIAETAWTNRALRIPAVIRHKNGSTFEFKTYNSGVGAFASDSVKGIWLDEDPQRAIPNGEEIFVECLQRTIDCQGMVWITATPVLGKNWMYERIYKQNSADVWHQTMSLLENRFINDIEKERARALLTADEIERRFYGLFSTLSGACFKELNSDTHYIDSFPIPTTWRKFRAIDLGYKNPFVCLWAALSEENILYFYAEYYQAETLLSVHADTIRKIDKMPEYHESADIHIENTVCDHARQERAELEQHGIYTDPAQKDVDLNIAIMNRVLKSRQVYVFRDRCPKLCEQLENYRYADTRGGDKEHPLKIDDHAVDAALYEVRHVFGETWEFVPPEHGERSAIIYLHQDPSGIWERGKI